MGEGTACAQVPFPFPVPRPARGPVTPQPPCHPRLVRWGCGGALTRVAIGKRGCGRVRGRQPSPLGLVLEDLLFVELASGAWHTGAQGVRARAGARRRGEGRGEGPAATRRHPPAAYRRPAHAECCTGAARRPARRPTGPRSHPWRGRPSRRHGRHGPSGGCLQAGEGGARASGAAARASRGVTRASPARALELRAQPGAGPGGSCRRRPVWPWERAGLGAQRPCGGIGCKATGGA